jgi:multiple sugar transport system ATP-binding protein
MATLELEAITKAFSGVPVLRDVSLRTSDGELLAVVGPSGCGKSTLLRIIAGLEAQDGGRVLLGGDAIDARPASRRNIAMVFQSYALYPHFTAAQNIALPLVMRDLTRRQRLPAMRWLDRRVDARRRAIAATVTDTARLLQIDGLLDRRPAQLSGGQRQRVALARALVRVPRLFLLDEPLSNLDAGLRAETRGEIVRLQRRLGVTTVLVTHDQVEAMTMADRVAVMFDGRIAQIGTPAELYMTPASLDVAHFIGTPRINVLPGTVGDHGRLAIAGQKLPAMLPGTSAGAEIHIAIRSEHLVLAPADAAGTLPCEVLQVEYLGAESFVHLRPRAFAGTLVMRLDPSLGARLRIGQPVAVAAAPQHLHVFTAAGARLGNGVAALPVGAGISA